MNMRMLNFKHFMKKYILKNDTLNKSELQKIYNYSIYPRDSKKYSDKDLLILITEAWEVVIGHVF